MISQAYKSAPHGNRNVAIPPIHEGERIALAALRGSWSVRKLADEINAAIARHNPIADLADRKLPPVLDAYKKRPQCEPKHILDQA